ncbi:V2 protein [Beet curly top virus]|uniref:V2 protein n=1 Tax=Beet curly top virus TaxID=10840 RepID=B9VGY8_9GEMI|nr:V2 protein [Beet curly top virus]
MGPFRVDQFPDNYPAFLAVSTSCFLRYNRWCILGIHQEIEALTLEEGEVFLQFQKEVKKLLRRKVNFHRKCALYEEIYKKYVHNVTEEKGESSKCVAEEEEDYYDFEEVPMEETCDQKQDPEVKDV